MFKLKFFICFSPDGKYITAGSENQCVYLWRTHNDSTNLTVRKDRNSYYEAIKGKGPAINDVTQDKAKVVCFSVMPRLK